MPPENEEMVTLANGETQTPTSGQPATGASSDFEARFSRLENVLGEQINENKRLQKELEDMKKPKVPEKAPEEHDKEFFNKPAQKVVEIVRDEIKGQIAPLLDFIGEVGRERVVDRARANVLSDPKLKKYYDMAPNQVEDLINRMGTPKTVSEAEANFKGALTGIAGAAALGTLQNISSVPKPAGTADTGGRMNEPAHLRPSGNPSNENRTRENVKREWTPNELRLMKENNLSEQEYIELLEVDPRLVTRWIPEKEREKK